MKQEVFRSLFPEPDYAEMTARLRRPTGKVDAILDTDAYNEIDDQFALAYLLRSEESVRLRAITAAPFYRNPREGVCRSENPGDGSQTRVSTPFRRRARRVTTRTSFVLPFSA